jgi:threonine dehydrogenase-like Zn-dependent dehydrogenase
VQSTDERLARSLAAAREGATDVRSFLKASAELRAAAGVPDALGAEPALFEALDAAEAGGKTLLFSDAKGMATFKATAAALQAKLGLKGANAAALEAAAAKEEAEAVVASVKAARDEAVATAKARDGLSYL